MTLFVSRLHLATLSVIALLASSGAHASVVPRTVIADMSVAAPMAFDSISGLEWLSPSATLRKTVSEIESGVGGWVGLGFRYATQADLVALLGNAGINTTPDRFHGSITADNASEVAAFKDLITIWGPTSVSNPPTQGYPFGQQNIFGILADVYEGDGQFPPSRTQASMFATDIAAGANVGGQWLYRAADAHVGSFLVRTSVAGAPVSAPPTFLLLASALGLLALTRSRPRA